MSRIALIALGWLSVTLGVVGIVLPLLPTTPFLLLASWCFAKSSLRFHLWLHQHKTLGPFVTAWESGQGFSLATKIRIISVIWLGMGLSMYLVNRPIATLCLVGIGSAVSGYILCRLPTLPR